jgi:hypothetical protein
MAWRESGQVNGPQLMQNFGKRTTATLNPEQRMTALGEPEKEAWANYRRREAVHGRRGDSYGPFKYPF